MQAPRRLQLRRGNTAAVSNYVGAPGELIVNTDNNTLFVHDGTTVGGIPATTNTAAITSNVSALQSNVSTLTANAGAQAGSIAALTSNAAVQAGLIADLQANAGAQAGSITTLTANAAVQAGLIATLQSDVTTLTANAGALAGSIATLTGNAATQAGLIADLTANAGVQAGAIVTANTAMKGYVDAAVAGIVIPEVYGNTNVAAYLTNPLTTLSSLNVTTAGIAQINGTNPGSELVIQTGGLHNFNFRSSGNLEVPGSIIPTANVAYSLGNITHQWRDLFVSNNTIYIGGVPLSIDASGNLIVNGNVVGGTNLVTYSGNVGASSITLDGATGPIGNVKVLNGGNGFTMFGFFAGAGGSGSGLSVVPQGSSLFDPVQINTRGTGYRVGDVITIVNTNEGNGYSNASVVVTSLQNQPAPSIFVGNSAYKFGADGNITLPTNTAAINYANGVNILSTIVGITSINASVSTSTINDESGDFSYGSLSYDYAVNGVTAGGFTINYSAPLVHGNVDVNVGNVIASNITTTNGIFWANGQAYSTGSNYSNINVASYLPTYSGNLSAGGYVGIAGQDGTTVVDFQTGAGTNQIISLGSDYTFNIKAGNGAGNRGHLVLESGQNSRVVIHGNGSNVQVTAGNGTSSGTWTFNTNGNLTLPSNIAAINYANGVSILSGLGSGGTTYSNTNVAAYLTTANITTTGNITAAWLSGNISITGNVVGTSPNVTIQAGSYSSTFNNQGNVILPNLAVSGNVISGGYFLGNGALLTGIVAGGASTYSNTNVAAYLTTGLSGTAPQIQLTNATSNYIKYNNVGVGAPTFTTSNVGTRIIYWSSVDATTADYAVGIDAGVLWHGIPRATSGFAFKWYAGTTQIASLEGTGNLAVSGNVSATNFIGNGALLTGIVSGGGTTYSNTNVAAYLGNVSTNINPSTRLTYTLGQHNKEWASAHIQDVYIKSTLQAGDGGIGYSGGNAGELLKSTGSGIAWQEIKTINGNSLFGNGDITISGGGSSYSNANVASYLPTYSGNVSAAYFIGNGALLTGIVAGGGTTYSNTNVQAYLSAGNVTSIIPASAYSNDLGSSGKPWGNFYTYNIDLSGGYLKTGGTGGLNGQVLKSTGSVNPPAWSNIADIISGSTGNFTFPANVTASYFVGNITNASGNVYTVGNAIIGVGGYTVLPTTIAQFTGNANTYTQLNVQNINSGTDATSEYVATANNGTDSTFFVDLGIANSNYDVNSPNNSLGTAIYANDSYLYAQGNTAATVGGNLVIGTSTASKSVKIFAGGINSGNIVATVANTGVSVTGNITATNNITATGNVTATYIVTTGGYGNITQVDTITANSMIATGNITVQGMGVVMSSRPAFRIYGAGSTNWTTANTNFKGSSIVVDYNQGSHFNSTTGVFTAPIAGLYSVTLTARIGNNNGQNQIMVIKNNQTSAGNVVAMWECDTNTGTAVHYGVSSVMRLAAGDFLTANITVGNVQFDANDSWTVTYLG